MTLARHDGTAYAVDVSPDGSLLVSSGSDGKLRVTRAATGEEVAKLHIAGNFNYTAAFAPDGVHVAGGVKSIGVWNTQTKKRVAACKGHKHEVNGLAFSPDGTKLASGSGQNWTPADHSVRIWDPMAGKLLLRVKLTGMVQALAWVDDSTVCALAGMTVYLVDARTGDVSTRVESVRSRAETMDVCRRSGRAIVGFEGLGGADVYGSPGTPPLELRLPSRGCQTMTRSVAARLDGGGFATGTTFRDYQKTPRETCVIANWDAEGKLVSQAEWPGEFLHGIRYSPDCAVVYSCDATGHVRGWHTADGSAVEPAPIAVVTKTSAKGKAKASKTKSKVSKAPDLVFADAFGTTRVTLSKKLNAKTNPKLMSASGEVSVRPNLKRALVRGRVPGHDWGKNGVALANLPGLGIRAKLAGIHRPCALLPGDEERVLALVEGELVVFSVDGDQLREVRRITADGAERRTVPLGPRTSDYGAPDSEGMIAVGADGTFAALAGQRLLTGKVDLDGDADRVNAHFELACDGGAERRVSASGGTAWLCVMEVAARRAHLLSVAADGATHTQEVAALGLPAVEDGALLYQPTNDKVVRRDPTGAEREFDVSVHNVHPEEEPEASFFKGAPPPPPRVLVGRPILHGGRAFFVPWHREQVVYLDSNLAIDRGLQDRAGPIRRAIIEVFARDNASLAEISLRLEPVEITMDIKNSTLSMITRCPPSENSFANALAISSLAPLHERFELQTHGWRSGGAGMEGGLIPPRAEVGAGETMRALKWMRGAGVSPLSVATVHEAYTRALGIPSAPIPNERPFSEDAERLWLRASVEVLRAKGWPKDAPLDQWAAETIAPARIDEAVDAINGLLPRTGVHQLSCVLVHHLDRDALPHLLRLMTGPARIYDQHRQAGELLVWLCHRHSDLKAQAVEHLETERGAADWSSDKNIVLAALELGKRHLWSNG